MKEIIAKERTGRRMADKRIQEIVTRYGYEAQSRQCIEEMAELTQAINKFWRKDLKCGYVFGAIEKDRLDKESEVYNNLIEEIADVEIMLEQMKEMLFCGDRVNAIKEEKLERQIQKLQRKGEKNNGI